MHSNKCTENSSRVREKGHQGGHAHHDKFSTRVRRDAVTLVVLPGTFWPVAAVDGWNKSKPYDANNHEIAQDGQRTTQTKVMLFTYGRGQWWWRGGNRFSTCGVNSMPGTYISTRDTQETALTIFLEYTAFSMCDVRRLRIKRVIADLPNKVSISRAVMM